MTAPEKLHRSVAAVDGSQLAIKDSNVGWSKIHRVAHSLRLSVRETEYIVVCGLHIETEETAHPLKSGHLLGRCCRFCWGSLVDEAGVAA